PSADSPLGDRGHVEDQMAGKRRSGVIVLLAAGLLLTFAVGTAQAAGRPTPHYVFSGCYDGTFVVVTQTWSAMPVDEVQAGMASDGGGFGASDALHRTRTGSHSMSLGFTDDPSEHADFAVLLNGQLV